VSEQIKRLLDSEVKKRDSKDEINYDKPDPILVAREKKDEFISLICALFAYGNAKAIVKFLKSLDFSLLDLNEEEIKRALKKRYYRFQNSDDVSQLFITVKRLKCSFSIEEIFYEGYKKEHLIIDGLREVISKIYKINPYRSKGYEFLIGKIPKAKPLSPYKRWNMYIRWMVRCDNIDFGLWKRVSKSDLIIPLDTHTFKVSKKLGLINRKTYDYKAAVLLTQKLKEFDKNDPVKYDFALYRLGQEGVVSN
jgi:uncharacterized protein (TIGR02757 family)